MFPVIEKLPAPPTQYTHTLLAKSVPPQPPRFLIRVVCKAQNVQSRPTLAALCVEGTAWPFLAS